MEQKLKQKFDSLILNAKPLVPFPDEMDDIKSKIWKAGYSQGVMEGTKTVIESIEESLQK